MRAPTPPERVLQRLDWQVIRRLDGLLQGDYRSLFHGAGIDLAALREYQSGDDVRYIDWNVTARIDTPYVRVYDEDREITARLLLDLSPSVDFGTIVAGPGEESRDKRAVLIDLVATLARVLTRRGNRVGAILYGSRVELTVPALGGQVQVLRLLQLLLDQPRLARSPVTDLAQLLEMARRTVKRRSLVVVVSDFISQPGWERQLTALNRRHEVLAVRLFDPREVDLPDVGLVILEDAETGERLEVDTHDAALRRRFHAAAQAREAAIADGFRRAGVDAQAVSTDEDLVRAIVRMAARRRRRGARAARAARPA